MKNIKVTVEYEVPKTSKFDALLAEYAIAKKVADETESYYKPLADLAEEAKFDAIMQQIEPIKYYAKQISLLRGDGKPVVISGRYYGVISRDFSVSYFPGQSQPFDVRWHGNIFSKDRLQANRLIFCSGEANILGNWDNWLMYRKLEECAIGQLAKLINAQKERGQKQVDRLHNIQGGI